MSSGMLRGSLSTQWKAVGNMHIGLGAYQKMRYRFALIITVYKSLKSIFLYIKIFYMRRYITQGIK